MLLLIPTEFEAKLLLPAEEFDVLMRHGSVALSVNDHSGFAVLCGMGMAAAPAGAAYALDRFREAHDRLPAHALLLGIAGTLLPDKAPVGSVRGVHWIRTHGVGVGQGGNFRGLESLGWQDWQGGQLPEVFDIPGRLLLTLPTFLADCVVTTGGAVTVTAASSVPEEAAFLAARYSEAILEEMEGYAVGQVFARFGVPFGMIRGISNIGGEREKSRWKTEEVLAALREKLSLTSAEVR